MRGLADQGLLPSDHRASHCMRAGPAENRLDVHLPAREARFRLGKQKRKFGVLRCQDLRKVAMLGLLAGVTSSELDGLDEADARSGKIYRGNRN